MSVSVRIIGQKPIMVEIDTSTTTVADLKKKIQDRTQIPAAKQKLILGGVDLGDEVPLKPLKLEHCACIHVVIRTAPPALPAPPAVPTVWDVIAKHHVAFTPTAISHDAISFLSFVRREYVVWYQRGGDVGVLHIAEERGGVGPQVILAKTLPKDAAWEDTLEKMSRAMSMTTWGVDAKFYNRAYKTFRRGLTDEEKELIAASRGR